MEETLETRQLIVRRKANMVWWALLAAALGGAAAAAGFFASAVYYFTAVLALYPLYSLFKEYLQLKQLQTILKLRKRWGKAVNKERDFAKISSLHQYLVKESADPGIVDGQTWRDLNMDQIYASLDSTFSAEGQGVLYHILRSPCLSQEPLQERGALIRAFQEDAIFREQLQLTLLPLNDLEYADNTGMLFEELPPTSPYAPVYSLLAIAALLSLFSPLVIGGQAILLIAGLFGTNLFIHHRINRNITHILPAFSNLAVLLRSALKITEIKNKEMGKRQQRLQEAAPVCKKLLKKMQFLYPKIIKSDLDFLYDYLKLFFLLEVRAFYATLGELNNNMQILRELYFIVGELDALQAAASYRESLAGYTEPVLTNSGTPYCSAINIHHPLLPAETAVANTIETKGQGLLITGSNMSGKSTFLRTMGVNALLGQTIYTCLADSFHSSFFRIVTSISREDNLTEGKSFYYQEAERLLKLIRAAESDTENPAFCIIDELLSGTNYTERLAASEAILNYLAQEKALVIVATHDLDVAEKLQGLYRCCHFTDQVGPEGLHFDFKLKEGIASTRNAIKLLSYLGYPEDIVKQADLLAGQPGN